MIKGAKGEDVDEDDDLDKKLALLKQKLNGVDKEKEIKLKYNRKTFLSLYDRWIKDIVKVFVETVEKYNDFYLECNHSINLSSNGQGIVFTNQSFENTSERFINMLGQSSQGESNQRDELTLQCSYRKFRKGGVNTFDSYYTVRITFTEIAYQIDMNGWAATSVRLLHEPFEEIEKKNFARKLGNDLLKQIEDNIAKLN
jgi:hypothetical protein